MQYNNGVPMFIPWGTNLFLIDSSQNLNAELFCETLEWNMNTYKNEGLIMMCGEYNETRGYLQ